jgi:hypothetical protein
MNVFKRKQNSSLSISRLAALNCTPVKNNHVQEMRLETGVVLLMYPAALRPWIAGLIRRFGRQPQKPVTKKLQLDELGSHVWDLIDGRRTVQRLIKQFAEKYQLHSKEAEVSVTQFLRELGRRGIIGLQEPNEAQGDT